MFVWFAVKNILFILIPFAFISCATTLSFDVKHPPMVDLRGVKTITVIPFEWSADRMYNQFLGDVTSAIIFGVRRGNITYVDAIILKEAAEKNYWNYVDVYITGRILDINWYDSIYRRDEIYSIITRTVKIDIEYSYIRAETNETIGHFTRSETQSSSRIIENSRIYHDFGNYNDWTRNPQGRNRNRQDRNRNPQDRNRNPQDRDRNPPIEYSYPSDEIRPWLPPYEERHLIIDAWTNGLVIATIKQLSSRINYELSPWTSKEERTVRGKTGASELNEALKMIKQTFYGRAMEIYSDLYDRTGDVLAGYNLALLLQFDSQYEDALELLKEIQKKNIQSGKRPPRFIITEIETLKKFIEGFKVLEGYGN